MPATFLKIMGFGLKGETTDGSEYRYIIFKDQLKGQSVEYLLNKKQQPSVWKDIEKIEKEEISPEYKGFILNFNGKKIVIIENQNLRDALENQNLKIDIDKTISYKEAEKLRLESKGYSTNITHAGAMEIAWKMIDEEAKIIRYRYYIGQGNFKWSEWYQIEG